MVKNIIISATDTDVGKTALSQWLCTHLTREYKTQYIKPIQCGPGQGSNGADNEGDADNISDSCPDVQITTLHKLKTPASPHYALALENKSIDVHNLCVELQAATQKADYNIIEGAGGILVPINDHELFIDLFEKLKWPVIVIVRPGLGTINHSLLTLRQLQNQNIPIIGFMSAPGNSELFENNMKTIEKFSQVDYLGKVPLINSPLFEDTDYFNQIWEQIEKKLC
jgi:dethiobiotin synthase